MLVFPTKTPDAVWSLALRYGHLYGLTAYFLMRGFALLPTNLQKCLIGDRFHVAIAQRARDKAHGTHRFGLWNVLLDFRTDGAVVYQGSILDHFSAMIDGDFGVLKQTVCIDVSDPQFGDLAGSTVIGL